MRKLVLVAALLMACSKGDRGAATSSGSSSAGSGSAGSGSVASGSAGSGGSAAVVADAPAVDAAVPSFFPAKLTEREGIIFAEKPGGSVEGIADGTKIEVVELKELGIGDGLSEGVKIKHGGKELKVSPARVLTMDAMHYSPDRKHVVFTPLMACGDVCHTELWLISADGRRTQLGEGTVDYYDAWNADTLAVSAGVLWLVTLADHGVKKYDDYMSPAFSPDGVLYVRTADGSAHTLINGKAKRVYKAEKRESDEVEDEHSVDGPPPVKFKNGKADFSTSFLPDEK